jgi:hypothetical protein
MWPQPGQSPSWARPVSIRARRRQTNSCIERPRSAPTQQTANAMGHPTAVFTIQPSSDWRVTHGPGGVRFRRSARNHAVTLAGIPPRVSARTGPTAHLGWETDPDAAGHPDLVTTSLASTRKVSSSGMLNRSTGGCGPPPRSRPSSSTQRPSFRRCSQVLTTTVVDPRSTRRLVAIANSGARSMDRHASESTTLCQCVRRIGAEWCWMSSRQRCQRRRSCHHSMRGLW